MELAVSCEIVCVSVKHMTMGFTSEYQSGCSGCV